MEKWQVRKCRICGAAFSIIGHGKWSRWRCRDCANKSQRGGLLDHVLMAKLQQGQPPVRTFADMTPEEIAHIRATTKPPSGNKKKVYWTKWNWSPDRPRKPVTPLVQDDEK